MCKPMKKITGIISVILFFSPMIYSCKTKAVKNDRCINVVQSLPSTTILPETEIKVIKSLFDGNRLDYKKIQFYQSDKDDLGFTHVKCYQYVNNLKVFSEELIFHFNRNNEHYLLSGNIINSTGLDAKQSLSKNKVLEIFIQKIEQEKASIVGPAILNGCFDIEFGYTRLNDSGKQFIKVWKVKPASKDYPCAYINDDNSEIINYDNGMRF